jgi:hypothetical protein
LKDLILVLQHFKIISKSTSSKLLPLPKHKNVSILVVSALLLQFWGSLDDWSNDSGWSAACRAECMDMTACLVQRLVGWNI